MMTGAVRRPRPGNFRGWPGPGPTINQTLGALRVRSTCDPRTTVNWGVLQATSINGESIGRKFNRDNPILQFNIGIVTCFNPSLFPIQAAAMFAVTKRRKAPAGIISSRI